MDTWTCAAPSTWWRESHLCPPIMEWNGSFPSTACSGSRPIALVPGGGSAECAGSATMTLCAACFSTDFCGLKAEMGCAQRLGAAFWRFSSSVRACRIEKVASSLSWKLYLLCGAVAKFSPMRTAASGVGVGGTEDGTQVAEGKVMGRWLGGGVGANLGGEDRVGDALQVVLKFQGLPVCVHALHLRLLLDGLHLVRKRGVSQG